MRIKRTSISDTRVKLEIAAEPKELLSAKNHVLGHLQAEVKIPGFREGKAPKELIEKNVDPNKLQTDFLDEIIGRLYVQAANAENLRPVEQPQISIVKFVPFTELEFVAEVEVVGKITLGNYKNIKIEKKPVVVTAKDVDEVVLSLQKRLATRSEVSRPAKNGDEVVLDFKGTDENGNSVSGAEGKEYPLLLGSNTFIPGFEPSIIGLKNGDEKNFPVTFPKDYGVSALQNKKVNFQVKIHKVNELKEPKADDAFAAQAGPFKTLAELKQDIKNQLTVEKQQEADRAYENELINAIASQSKLSLPKTLVDDQIVRGEQDERQNLAYRGQTWQEHLKEEGVSEEEHRERNRPTAEQSVKMSLVLSEISEKEGISVTPEELEVRLQILKSQYQDPAMQGELDKPESRQDITNRLMTEKTIAKLVEYSAKK